MEKVVEADLGEDQFRFRRNVGTLTLRLILEDRLKKGKPSFPAFVDLENVFDTVDWIPLFEIVKAARIKYRERKVVYNLYRLQTTVIRVEGPEREAAVEKGVRKGCSLSPLLFNLSTEHVLRETKENLEVELKCRVLYPALLGGQAQQQS